MLIKLTTSMAGHGFALNPGDVVDKPDAEAQRLITAGFAVPVVENDVELERATAPDVEPIETRRAAPAKPRRRRRKREEVNGG